MKRTYQIFALIGAVIWAAAVLVRGTGAVMLPLFTDLVGVAPNFGVMWVLMGLGVSFFPRLYRREAGARDRLWLAAGAMGVLLLSEIVHTVFFGAGFDWLDLLASLVAAGILLLVDWLGR